jgi:hypothetical protein
MNLFGPLYELTDRDRETLLIEPYFRRVLIDFAIGVDTASGDFITPNDRCLFITHVSWTCFGQAATRWSNARLEINPGLPTAHVISSFGSTEGMPFIVSGAPTGQGGSITDDISLVIPAGIRVAGVLSRIGNTAVAQGRCDLTGYLIPPGTIGRGY